MIPFEINELNSKYDVFISFRGFASSEWCLDELVKILECGERYGRKVIPVFYGGVDPSHVENLTGSYRKVPSETIGKVRSWRAALTTAASFSGFDSRVIRGLIARGSAVG
ncbi:Disease resistance protein TAO1 [Linum perenne]